MFNLTLPPLPSLKQTCLLPVFVLAMMANEASAQSLDKISALNFQKACLSKAALKLRDGSEIGNAGGTVNLVQSRFNKSRFPKNLKNRVKWSTDKTKRRGRFYCAVYSKDLELAGLVTQAKKLRKKSPLGKLSATQSKARFDDGPNMDADGVRYDFSGRNWEMQFEAIHWQSKKGPVGAMFLTIDHDIIN